MTEELPLCSAVFLRTSCPHGRLFEDEYKRSNRNRGTKILRCFPHCCPHHVDRSYCGSPLDVSVNFASQSDVLQSGGPATGRGLFDASNFFVFARFESVGGETLSSASHSLRYLRSVSQSPANPEASWVEGVRQTSVDRHLLCCGRESSRTPSSSSNSNPSESATFQLNGQPFAKWYYHWESGANKVHRSTKHVLKAYIFYLAKGTQPTTSTQLQDVQQHADGGLELVCVATSPPFTVVSYRRSPLEVTPPSSQLATSLRHSTESDLRRLVQHQISQAFQNYDHQQPPVGFLKKSENRMMSHEYGKNDQHWRLRGAEYDFMASDHAEGDVKCENTMQAQLEAGKTQHKGGYMQWSGATRTAPLLQESKAGYSLHTDAINRRGFQAQPPATTESQCQGKPASGVVLRIKQLQRQLSGHPRELQKVTDLAIVHFFVSRLTTTYTSGRANLEVALAMAIGQHFHYSFSDAAQLSKLLCIVIEDGSSTSPDDAGAPRSIGANVSAERKLDEIALLLVDVCVWAFSLKNTGAMKRSLEACIPLFDTATSSSSSTGGDLLAGFLNCTTHCWNELDQYLQNWRGPQTTIRSVRKLCEAIMGVIFSRSELEELRPGLKAVLQRPTILLRSSSIRCSGTNLAGWKVFVAQVREGYVREQYSERGYPWSPVQATASQWTADWRLFPASLTVNRHYRDEEETTLHPELPSLWTLCLAVSQLLHLKLAVVGQTPQTLYVQAQPSLLPLENTWLRLICDGRLRIAPVTPNGLTTLMCGSSYSFGGDYIAYPVDERSTDGDNSSICVESYWWPVVQAQVETAPTAFRSALTLTTANEGFLRGRMDLERGFVKRNLVTAASTPQLELWSPAERLKAVTDWRPWLSIEGTYTRK